MLSDVTKDRFRPFIPPPALRIRRTLRAWWRELPLKRLELAPLGTTTLQQRRALMRQINLADAGLLCAHTPDEISRIVAAILAMPPSVGGAVVEAGCFKGSSTAKLSLAARQAGRRLVVFDSFAGLPDHAEAHGQTIFGAVTDFYPGRYAGRLEEVQANVRRCGAIDACTFVEGWFEDTMPGFHEPVAVAFIDVDLAPSTRTRLKYLYPLLYPADRSSRTTGICPLC